MAGRSTRWLTMLAVLGVGFALGLAWFRLEPAIAPHLNEQTAESGSPDSLPLPEPAFDGRITRSYRQSQAGMATGQLAQRKAPNVLVVITDDVGFGAASTFGGPIPTPHLDALADGGLRYSRFHTTAMCSPTRAAALTGRNAHRVGSGMITELATDFPGYNGRIPRSAATIGRLLNGHGYSTGFFGKHHNVPLGESGPMGPFDHWPTGLGFDYFYGFLGGDVHQFQPRLFRGTQRAAALGNDAGPLDRALATDLIRWLRHLEAADPEQPFLAWYAPGTPHAPHHAPRDWIERFEGAFDDGWDALRESTFARQQAMGLIPEGSQLTPRPDDLPAWDNLSAERQAVNRRFMEVYAAMLAYQDEQIGRVLDELRRMGRFDNTLVLFVQGDNGASAEGGIHGSLNEIGRLANGVEESLDQLIANMDALGGPDSYPIFPTGWAWALDTPFQWTKTVASHLGGTRTGLVVSWPDGIQARGETRTQFHHVIDLLPTVLDVAGISPPGVVDGIRQQSMDGVSIAYSFDQADAPGQRRTQYFELFGQRAIYHEGWMANTVPGLPPWSWEDPDHDPLDDDWELYHLDQDFSQARDLASVEPARLAELQSVFDAEAQRNGVYPLDNRRSPGRVMQRYLANWQDRDTWTFWGPDVSLPFDSAPPLFARDFTMTAELSGANRANGVLVGYGSRFGGWALWLDEGRVRLHHAFSQHEGDQFRIASIDPLPAGEVVLEVHFDYDGGGLGRGGEVVLQANGTELARGRIERTITVPAGLGETFDVGADLSVPVVDEPSARIRFNGNLHKLEVRPGMLGLLPF